MTGVLLDLDGVVYVGDEAIAGAPEAVARLDAEGVPYCYLTNTTSRPRSAIVASLARLGVGADAERILTPAVAAAAWLRREGIERPALFVPDATATEFAGLEPLAPSADEGAGAVVVGDLGEGWEFATLNRAFRLLMADPHVPLVALGLTRYWRAPDGLRLDVGAFVRALEHASGREAVVLGKPDPAFYGAAVAALGVDPSDVVMVGDDIRSDVDGAQRAGLTGVLVRTGKFSPADLDGEVRPDAVLDSIADLPDWLAARRR
ncbi:TIGR01458 family HAD-type hydrolase [Agromyces indicus]|uniref:Haloacid dehalogenase-like hydrolase domain-containing protein 2 n=1 Tax=Agromyces indicus TaxID=758919 RepID=A0ABU1FKM1_9MICO|nr:TIGR01458 family HAD-type hydrolase [Agromyces indicus]MDR5691897.1 TIGR01458 family HAD-type hydrolase [Agromyces indicus]